ncbi:unnamed protein product [Mucor hiemalis]
MDSIPTSPLNNYMDRRASEALPPIQLPPPIIHHFYIAPPHQAPSWQPQTAHLPLTPPPSTSKSSPPKSNNNNNKDSIRKSSHSAVEKRRRERMNDKIDRLKTLIPSCNAQFPTTVQQPIHKLSVLQAAIDYIDELHKQLESTLPKDNPILKEIVFMQKKDQIK